MKSVLIDIMLDGRFYTQVRYTERGFPVIGFGGKIEEVHKEKDIRRFIEEKRPSLRGKDYQIEFSQQKV